MTQTTTVLPNPLFGNSEAATGSLNVLRSINGNRRTYVQTKSQKMFLATTGQRRKLRWDFRLTRNKALEILEFYRAYGASQIFIKDHNDRGWAGWITNNPFEIEASSKGNPGRQDWPVGESCNVSIEFEGQITTEDITQPRTIVKAATSGMGDLDQDVFLDLPIPTLDNTLRHNWDASQIVQADGSAVNTWTDGGSASNDLVATVGSTFDPAVNRAPVYRSNSAIFNNRPTVAFEYVDGSNQSVAAMETTSNTEIFPGKRGTVFWVFAHTVNDFWSAYLTALASGGVSSPSAQSALDTALSNRSFATNVEYGVWSLQKSGGLPETAHQVHMSGSSSPYFPLNARFEPANPVLDTRLATDNTNSVPSLTPAIYVVNRDSNSTLRFRTNGIERSGATITTSHPAYTGKFHINDQTYAPEFNETIRGEWAQCMVYQKSLTTEQMQTVEQYLSARWGVPLLSVPF